MNDNLFHTDLAIIVAHMDDETLGAGGLLAKRGGPGHLGTDVLALTDSVSSRGFQESANPFDARVAAYEDAGRILGFNPQILNVPYPDNAMDSVTFLEVVRSVECWLDNVDPEVVITHHPGDLNIDHQITAKAVMTALRPGKFPRVNTLLTMEVLSSTEYALTDQFHPNVFVPLGIDEMGKKIQAMTCYDTEMEPPRNDEGIVQQGLRRAFQMGEFAGAAEAFHLVWHRMP